MKTWSYTLPKEQLAMLVAVYGLDDTGTLDEIRKRMRGYAEENPEEFASNPRELGEPSTAIPQNFASGHPPADLGTPVFIEPANLDSQIINQIRKWGCHFDGRDPAAFAERLELRESYGFTGAQLLRGLPELLKGDALLWYRNYRAGWTTWREFEHAFRLQYFPNRYAASLRREIASRHQKSNEKFAQYIQRS